MKFTEELLCDCCEFPLASDIDRGWVSWWCDDGDVVQHFDVTCNGGHSCLRRLESRREAAGLVQRDGHLDWFTGWNAMWRLQELLWLYVFEPRSEPMERCFDFFLIAERLPPTKKDLMCRHPLGPSRKARSRRETP